MRKERIETPDNIPHAEPPFSDDEINCYRRGDCEMIGGGRITATDALLALRAAMGLIEGSDACDFNGDGAVDSQDALLILRYSMGLI